MKAQPGPAFEEPEMVFVEGGSFEMGVEKGLKKEMPQHRVTVANFYIGKYEVTQELWMDVMDYNPSGSQVCSTCPVEDATPEEIALFIEKLNKATGKNYRLPTEAEWEYAAIGGNKSKGYIYSGSNDLNEVAWNVDNAEEMSHPVGQKKPNELGLYDMSGNVWELCQDWYDPKFYHRTPANHPVNTTPAKYRVVRGGSWRSGPKRCYNQARNRNIKDHHIQNMGFRLALDNG